MLDGLNWDHGVLMAALYLRGLPRPFEVPRRFWPHVLHELRRSCASAAEAGSVLFRAGFEGEATLAGDPGLLARAERHIESSRVLTVVSPRYPSRWIERLGPMAPAALWWNGTPFLSSFHQDEGASSGVFDFGSVAIVGSRVPGPRGLKMAAQIGDWAQSSGVLVVSGGAIGCDAAGVRGARRAARRSGDLSISPSVEILPVGFEQVEHWDDSDRAYISACEPWATFSTPQAMERNALIYASSPWSVVVHCRFRAGGSWIGASEALRRRLSRVAIFEFGDDPAVAALKALGATGFDSLEALAQVFGSPPAEIQPELALAAASSRNGWVRAPRARYAA
jgi:hypothetical protein